MSNIQILQEDGPQPALWDEWEVPAQSPFRETRPLRDHPSRRRMMKMAAYVLRFFPELACQTIEVGITRGAEGRALVGEPRIWLNPRGLCHHTIAHELIHVLQGRDDIPAGERSCDVYSLARDHTLVDARPAYLQLPDGAFDARRRPLPGVPSLLTRLAREAIERRRLGNRRYITWFENEVWRTVKGSLFR
jgi:hypothetical protein